MAVLQRQEAEIPLNGGMDVKQGAELQSVSTLRLVEDLRWNAQGEFEKRPAQLSLATLAAPSGSVYTSTRMSGVIARGDETLGITQDFGLVSNAPASSDLTFMRRPVDEAATVDAALKHAPVCANVSRRFVARSNGKAELGVEAVASAVYGTSQLIAWATSDGTDQVLHAKVINIDTGVVVMPEQTVSLGASGRAIVSAIPIAETGYEGILVSVGSESSPAPFEIKAYRWIESTNDFGLHATLTSNAKTDKHALAANGQSYYFAYTDNTTGFLHAYSATIAGGLGTLHTATHSGLGGVSIVVGATRALIACVTGSSIDFGAELTAEVFGTPASVINLRVITGALGVDWFFSCSATLETRSGLTNAAVVFGTGIEQTGSMPDSLFVSAHVVDFTSTAPTEIREQYIPHAACVGSATVDGRAHGIFAINPIDGFGEYALTSLIVARVACAKTGSSDPIRFDPVARVGHERFYLSSYADQNGNCAYTSGSSIYVTLQADPVNRRPQSVFVARTDFTARPTPYADMGDGTVVFGNGILHAYDGDTPSEAQPVCRPIVGMVDTGVGTLNGTYGAIAVFSWIDAAGNLHRSEPSAPRTLSVVNRAVDVYVSRPPFAAYDGVTAPEITCELYLTGSSGSVYYRAGTLSFRTYSTITTKELWFQFIAVPSGSSSLPEVYTTQAGGEERASKAPPAFRAITRVGDLLWAIDAEDPSRIWHTKPLVAGFAPEWNTLNTLFIGDSGVGISDVNGVPTIFAEHGIWQVYGEGPNATGVGSFAPARRLPHEVECMDAASVCKTSAGVFFRGRRGVYMLDAGLALQPVGLAIDPSLSEVGTPAGFCRIAYDELANEVHVIDFGNTHYVFNLLEGKWSTYTQNTGFQNWQDMRVWDGRVVALHRGSSDDSIMTIKGIGDSDRSAHTQGWALETPWIRFDGATGEMRIWEVIPQVRVTGQNGGVTGGDLTVSYEVRDRVGNEDTFTWSDASIFAMSQGEENFTLNLRCRISQQRARQFRVIIREDTPSYNYSGHVPIAMRVLYGITPRGARQRSTTQLKGAGSSS